MAFMFAHRFVAISLLCFVTSILAFAQPLTVEVNANMEIGELTPVWQFFGYDEPNYTYMNDGQKLLSELASANRGTVYIRTHNLLTSGDGTAALKWGSTNVYTEDVNGKPIYDFSILDRIFDTLIERRMKPLVELGFMPEALSTNPAPYRHAWTPEPGAPSISTGWAYPPKDYAKWGELVYQVARHCAERYGQREAESWLWEVWNEPNILYWRGTPEEYHRLYDFAADAVKRALPAARIGGPHSTGPGGESAAKFLRDFLKHAVRGKNYATGETGAPLDFIAFHAKGRPKVVDAHVQMGSQFQLRDIDSGFAIVASFPELRKLPIVIGESDPEGCAACGMRWHPQNGYRNGTMYASYTAATFARKFELASLHGVNFLGAVTWAFEFEGQPYFDGFRDLSTNGVAKPVLDTFRMLGMMASQRIHARSDGALPLDTFLKDGVKAKPDINVLASRGARRITILLWNYHDDDLPAKAASIELDLHELEASRVMVEHYRVDEKHSNSYEVWRAMGSPQEPTEEQRLTLEASGDLASLHSPQWKDTQNGRMRLSFQLPRQAVSLLVLSW